MPRATEADIQQFMQDVGQQQGDEPAVTPEATPENGEVTIEDRTRAGSADSDPVVEEVRLPSDVPEDLNEMSKEDLIKLLQEKQTEQPAEEPKAQDDKQQEEPAEESTEEAVEVTLESISEGEGMLSDDEFGYFFNEYDSGEGALSDESYEALAKRGFPKELVNQHIAGTKALVAQNETELHSIVGGKDDYQSMLVWASKNLSEGEAQRFDAIVTGSDQDAAKDAVTGLYARMKGDTGREPTTTATKAATPTSAGTGYHSQAELQADMQNPRYFTDEMFRNAVDAKFRRSDQSLL